MTILHSWKQSLSLFAPTNFVKLMREIARSIEATYRVLLQNWYLLLLVVPELMLRLWGNVRYEQIMVHTFLMRTKYYGILIHDGGWHTIPLFDVLLFFLYISFIFAICLAARYATQEKNWTYFKLYIPHLINIALLIGVSSFIIRQGAINLELIYASKIAPLYMFFYLDSRPTCKALFGSFGSMATMILYNLPLMALFFLVIIVVPEFTIELWNLVPYSLCEILNYFFFWPVLINIWVVIYGKLRREQSELYRD